MKDLANKLISALSFLKGKKPAIVVVVLAILILGYYGVQKGYIPESLLNVGVITEQVEKFFPRDTTKAVVDTLVQPVADTLIK